MGVDLRLGVKTKRLCEEKELKELNYRFLEASSLGYGKKPINLSDEKVDESYIYEVDTTSRLYSQRYARGHFPEIYCAIEWLRYNFPEGEILYGGDHCFIEETPVLSKEEQEKLLEFWCKSGGLTYRQRKPQNDLFRRVCPNCEQVMNQYMWSGGSGEVSCLGCKYKEKTQDQGQSWKEIVN